MADNFASYFPVTVTGGTTNPMAGAETVQGQNPQALGLDPILAAIQSQYTPQTFTQSGGSYGAGRFIDGGSSVAGVGSPVTGSPISGGGNVAQPWFSPGEFNLADYQNNLPTEVAEQVATGDLYGGESASPVGNVGSDAWKSDPYNSLFNPVPGWAKGVIGGVMPGMGAVIGAGQGYNNAVGTNAMNTALGAYGSEGFGEVDPAMAALWGAFGITPDSVQGAQTMAGYFDNPESMFGYMAAGVDPAISQIVSYALATQAGQTQMTPTAQDVGAMGNQIGEQINAAIAAGKGTVSLSQAVTSVAIQNGIPPSQAAEMGVNAAVASVTNGLAAGLTLADIDPAAVAAYNDPMGALIDSLGITGKINESVTAATSPINEQLASLAASDEAFNKALAGLNAPPPADTPSISLSETPPPAPQVTTPAVASPVGDSSDGLTSTIADGGYQGPMSHTEGTVNGVTVGAPIGDGATTSTPTNNGGSRSISGGGDSGGGVSAAQAESNAADAAAVASAEAGMAASIGGGNADSSNAGDGGYGSGTAGYDAGDMGHGDGGGGGGGGKIICTAMNQAYGFGSFRNAIWIKYADKHLTKAHEVGYHTLFLPLVDYGFKRGDGKANMIVRKVLEWGTRHRSMDLRAEMRNKKRDTTGRVIRMVFEPLCYVVGKIKGY